MPSRHYGVSFVGDCRESNMQSVKAPHWMTAWMTSAWHGLCAVGCSLWRVGQCTGKPVYRCPGNLYHRFLMSQKASDKGCRTGGGAHHGDSIGGAARWRPGAKAGRSVSWRKVSSDEQKARDSDAKRILEAELKRPKRPCPTCKRNTTTGQPERKGDERNNQKYLDRVAEMKAALTRKEADGGLAT